MQYTNNNIIFNNVKTQGIKLSASPMLVKGLVGTDPDDGTGIVNAVDIDWNDANLEPLITNEAIKSKISNLKINTTGDLLKLIIELINLIKIETYWFSIGPEEITASNYTIANGAQQVTSYPTSYESVERKYLYCLIPDTKTIQFIEPTLGAPIEFYEQDITIPGYKVYKSSSKIMGIIDIAVEEKSEPINENETETENENENEEEQIIQNKFWYSIGPDEITLDNYTTVNNAQQLDEYPVNSSYSTETRQYIYCLISENKTIQFIEPTFNAPIELYEQDINIPGYKVYKSSSKIIDTINIKIS